MAPQPSPAFSVREAATADAPTIADLTIELGYHIGVDEVRQRLAALPATHVVFVATNREQVVGWLHAFHGHSVLHGDRVEIAGLSVAANRQSQGVGTALITHLERWTLKCGVHSIRLLSGSQRTADHQFYRIAATDTSRQSKHSPRPSNPDNGNRNDERGQRDTETGS